MALFFVHERRNEAPRTKENKMRRLIITLLNDGIEVGSFSHRGATGYTALQNACIDVMTSKGLRADSFRFPTRMVDGTPSGKTHTCRI